MALAEQALGLRRRPEVLTGEGRTIPGFHDGGSLAGNDSARVSSTASSLSRSGRTPTRSLGGSFRNGIFLS